MTSWIARLLCFALCLLLLAGCRGGKTPPPPAAVTAATSPAGAEPGRVELPAENLDPSLGERRCLRILPLPTEAEAQAVSRRIKAGENFLVLSREYAKGEKHGPLVRCLQEKEMEAEVLRAVGGLRLGEVSPAFLGPFGWAVAMATTDEYWKNGNAYFEAGRYEQAEAELLKDVAINPDGPSWHLIAMARSARKDSAGALNALDQALVWAPLDPALLNDKASLLMDLGQIDEAVALYQDALYYSPDNPLIMNNLAWCLARNGKDLERAEQLAQQAVTRQPDRAEYWDTLGMVQQMAGKADQAALSYGRALKLNPEMAQAKANLVPTLISLDTESLQKLLQQKSGSSGRPRLAGPSRR